jgi:hypothetical protein
MVGGMVLSRVVGVGLVKNIEAGGTIKFRVCSTIIPIRTIVLMAIIRIK